MGGGRDFLSHSTGSKGSTTPYWVELYNSTGEGTKQDRDGSWNDVTYDVTNKGRTPSGDLKRTAGATNASALMKINADHIIGLGLKAIKKEPWIWKEWVKEGFGVLGNFINNYLATGNKNKARGQLKFPKKESSRQNLSSSSPNLGHQTTPISISQNLL